MNYLTADVGGRRIRYLRMGSGRPLLFLHGIGGTPEFYAPLLGMLAKEYAVIAPAIYGLTYFDRPPECIADAAALTGDFCAAVGVRPEVIVGHSYGGAVALGMPLDKRTKLILINPPPQHTGSALRLFGAAMIKGLPPALGMRGLHAMRSSWIAAGLVVYTLLRHPVFSWRVIRDVARFRYPAHCDGARLLFGEDDELCTRLQKDVVRKLPMSVKVLPGHKHDWPLYSPRLAYDEIRAASLE